MLEELLQKFVQNPGSLSNTEREEIFKAWKSVLSGKKPEHSSSKNVDEFLKVLNDAQTVASKTPEGKLAMEQMIRDHQTDRVFRRNKPFFDAILAGADLATSLSQIKESNRAVRDLQPPVAPSPSVLDPQLNAQIAQAQQGNLQALRAVEPMKQQIEAGRASDLNTARSISSGQSGAMGSLATAATLRANRAAASLPAIQDDIVARQQQRVDNLVGVRQGVLQSEFDNRMRLYNTQLDQYNQDTAAAGQLGQMGRTNLRTTVGRMPEIFTRAAGAMMPVQNPYDTQLGQNSNIQSQPSDEYDAFRQSVRQSMMDRIRRGNQTSVNKFLYPNPSVVNNNGVNRQWDLNNFYRNNTY